MKKKLLFCSYDLNIGGIENALINLLNNMDYSKYDITLILERKQGVFLDKLNPSVNVKEYRVSNSKNIIFRKIYNFFKKYLWALKNYHKYDFSCCYATYSFPCNFLAYYGSKNNLFYIHNNYNHIYDEMGLREFFDNRRINLYRHVAFVSNESRTDMIKYYPDLKERFIVINNLINYQRVIELSKEKVDIKKSYKNLFVYVGRLDEHQKRISRLIKCIYKLDDVELWIIGDGPDRNSYEEMASTCDRIKFLGSKKNPYPYMKAADYIILSSDYEGFPVVYSEAIILGKKLITTIDVTDEFISIPNRFGYIVSKDEEKMVDEIKNILKHDDLKAESVDFKVLNKNRVKMLEEIIDEVI